MVKLWNTLLLNMMMATNLKGLKEDKLMDKLMQVQVITGYQTHR